MKLTGQKRKSIILLLIIAIYFFVVVVHVFIPKSGLNIALSEKIILAQYYAFPVLFGGAAAFLGVIVLTVGCLRNKKEYLKSTGFRSWLGILIISVIFAAGAIEPTTPAHSADEEKPFRIVEWNTEDKMDAAHIRKIFGAFDADAAVFPEFGGYEKGDDSHRRIRALFTQAGIDPDNYAFFISRETGGNIAPVTIVIKKGFADYSVGGETAMTGFGTVYLKPESGNAPGIVGLHTAPPAGTDDHLAA